MTKPGPKARPTALRVVSADDKAPEKTTAQPPPLERLPPPPTWLRPEAKEEWKRLGPRLIGLGLLSGIDLQTFGAYCQAVGNWHAAEKALVKLQGIAKKDKDDPIPELAGLVAKTTGGNLIHHPLGVVAQKARQEAIKIAAEFGLTPSSRSRIDTDAAKNKGGADPTKAYFDD